MSGLVIIIVVAALVIGGGGGDLSRATTFAEGVPAMSGAFAASITAFFSFLGFEAAANMAEEVKDPAKSYPKALFGAILTAGVVYLLIALSAGIVVPTDQLAASQGPLLEVIKASGIAFPPWLFAAIALVAIGNGALLFMVMASRATYGLAEAHLLPPVFGQIAPTRRTPWVAILVVGAVTMGMSFIGDVGMLADTTVLLLVLVFISANLSALILKKDKVAHQHFVAPKIVSILALIASVLLLTQQSTITWMIGGGYIIAGTALFFIAQALNRRAGIKPDTANLDAEPPS
ncbi:MAG: amino acid permease [Propioniciclava sp.]|uniref:APC family permease n=1 Tax=Propioniciclava sp. TaxID=2038686 RepID=UPI0039E62D1B